MIDFYRFKAEAGDEAQSAELLIFDAIGEFEEMGEISAKAFARDLGRLPKSVKRLDIHINSPGGSVYDAQAIYSRLADHRAEKIVYIDGLAASAASIVAMVGHRIFIRANANMMIHLPSAMTIGNEDEHEKSIRALRSITAAMLNTYHKKTGLARDEIRDLLADETWFTAEEAVEKGFADEVRGVIKAAATFDLSKFRYQNIPTFMEKTMRKKIRAQAEDDEKSETVEETPKPKPSEQPQPERKEDDEAIPEEAVAAQPKPQPKPPPGPPPPPPPTNDYERGVQAERDRVLALQQIDRPATHALITAAIKDGRQVTDIMIEAFSAMDKANAQAARRADASSLGGIPPSDSGDGHSQSEFGKLIAQKLEARNKRGLKRSTK